MIHEPSDWDMRDICQKIMQLNEVPGVLPLCVISPDEEDDLRVIAHLIRNGKVLAKQYGFEEMLDATQEVHDAIALFEGLEVGE